MALAPKNGAISSAVPSTIAASTTWPCPGALRVEQPGDQPEGEQHPAAPEVGHQVERRRRQLAGATDVGERAGHRRVGDVVAGGLGQRALLAPAGHAPVDEPRVPGEAVVRSDAEPLGHPRPEALERARRHCSTRRSTTSAPPGALRSTADGPAPAAEDVVRGAAGRRAARPAADRRAMTSAPRSASTMAQNGPGPIPAISTTRRPASGPIVVSGRVSRRSGAARRCGPTTRSTARTSAGPNSRLAQAMWPSSSELHLGAGDGVGELVLLGRRDGPVAGGDEHRGGHVDLADPAAGVVAADGLARLHDLHHVVAAHLPRGPGPQVGGPRAASARGTQRRMPGGAGRRGRRPAWCRPRWPSSS